MTLALPSHQTLQRFLLLILGWGYAPEMPRQNLREWRRTFPKQVITKLISPATRIGIKTLTVPRDEVDLQPLLSFRMADHLQGCCVIGVKMNSARSEQC